MVDGCDNTEMQHHTGILPSGEDWRCRLAEAEGERDQRRVFSTSSSGQAESANQLVRLALTLDRC